MTDILPQDTTSSCGVCERWERQFQLQASELANLQTQLAERDQQLVRLHADMEQLNAKYVSAIDRVADIQHEKDLVEHDLEELSCKLFEEANGMVAIEKREKWLLESQLQTVQQQLLDEKAQLSELRQRLWDNDQRKRHGRKQKKQQLRSASMPPPSSSSSSKPILPTIDQVQLEAFQQFVHTASSVPLKKLYQFAYMKYCQLEDVEPCLRFGPHSRLSVKKMMDYLLQQSCFIEQMSLECNEQQHQSNDPMKTAIPSSVAQRSLIWERWHNKANNTTIGCAACGRQKTNQDEMPYYQFKMDEKDDWLPMDQYCRDRLVAVCEFFVFIRNIHLRLYSHRTIDDLYSENIRLRLQMFYSR
ncbi:uncharacterized protein BX664DRAFT_270581 [Halteromyces radiatus]|uniref:uncharacterized protein n=1 Tax=Halteromyces radiatus TaxID=101107 RepID=UPI0022209869|nr:uncharacterized protein BX664DRAFT_270581 [Halteromyces radiatus]KAI8077872.1 hypothetical protein BX664DRAFT_270581 [Halteromyces radiatus]